ncbi:MAG: TonB-dependent receptor [Pseudomonadota bacterium]
MNGESIKKRLLATTLFAGLAGGTWSAALAQEAEEDETIVVAETDEQMTQERVIVTGSRIARPDLATSFSTQVLDTETIERNAFTNIGDALNTFPSFGAGIDPVGDQGANVGVQFVDLFNLGSQRTLALVNGRRVVSQNVSGGGAGLGVQVDLSTLPIGLVERIDVVPVSGAPIYGSDAIAGTVNVILKDDFEGIAYQGQYGETFQGDFENFDLQFTIGANTPDGKGNVTLAFEYQDTAGGINADRPEFFVGDAFFSDTGDGFELFFGGQNVQLFTDGGVVAPTNFFLPSIGAGSIDGQFFGFNPDGTLGVLEPGASIPGTSLFFAEGGFENPFFSGVDQIVSPVERFLTAGTYHYDFTDNFRFVGDFQFSNVESIELVEQGGFQTFAFDGFSDGLTFSVDNPFLTDQARGILTGAGLDTFSLQRFNNDLIDSSNGSESTTWRIAAGFEGEFETLGREFRWDISAVAGQFTNELFGTAINDRRFLLALDARELSQADVDALVGAGATINPETGSPFFGGVGDIVCNTTFDFTLAGLTGDTTTQTAILEAQGLAGAGIFDDDPTDITACAPLNLFGFGAPSAEAIDYVVIPDTQNNDIDQAIYTANFGGELIEVPAGWLTFNVGYESRRERISLIPDGGAQTGIGRGAATPPSSGSFTTDEYYAEANLPIVSPEMDIPFVRSFELDGAFRTIRNSISGTDNTWVFGGQLSPIEGLTFRGNRARSVRAPSLIELFQTSQTTFQFADDPCDADFIEEGNAANRQANCAAAGVPIDADGDGVFDFASNIQNATATGTTSGNPNLTPEISDAFDVGVIIQPTFIPNLTVQATYTDFNIQDLIIEFDVEANLDACFDADPADFPNPAFCDTFTRDAGSQVVDFEQGFANASIQDAQFITASVDYNFDVADAARLFGFGDFGDLGNFEMRYTVFHVRENDLATTEFTTAEPQAGGFVEPDWSGLADFTYNRGPLTLFWRAEWQDPSLLDQDRLDIFFDENGNEVETTEFRVINDFSIAYDVGTLIKDYDNPLELQFNVLNVFDRDFDNLEPIGQGGGDFALDELLGRRFLVTIRGQF